MAKRSELLYWVGTEWANARFRHYSSAAWASNDADAGTDSNPVKTIRIIESVGNPRSGEVTIINRPKDSASSTGQEGKGRFTDTFTDFQDVMIRDGETGTILLSGKIYNLEEEYDSTFGNLIHLTIRDNLEELKNYKTGTWINSPLAYTTSSRISSDIVTLVDNVSYLDTDSISFSDTDKYEASATVYDQAGAVEFPGNSTVLKTVSNLAKKDPHANGMTEDYGYDYLLDPAVITSAVNTKALPAWNYFKRGTRPSTAPETHGLTVKFPSTPFAKDGYNSRMMSDFKFSEPKSELFSDVSLTFRDRSLQVEAGEWATDGTQGDADFIRTSKFERINVTFTNDGSFTGEAFPIGYGELLSFTPSAGGGATNFARFEYQSVVRAGTNVTGFIVVSPMTSVFTAAFPEVAGTITGTTSGKTATTTTSCRPAVSFGVRKTKAVNSTDMKDPQKIRQEVASYLSRNTTTIKRGTYKVTNYPYHYIDAAADKVSISSGTVSFASAAFATNGGSATNNPELFGIQIGDVIAELDAAASTVTRYAYISTTTSSTVVYGGNTAANTNDGVALNEDRPMRIYKPLRTAHIAKVENTLAGVSGTHLITEIEFQEDNGVSFTTISSVGKNDSVTLNPNLFDALIEGAESYGDINARKNANIANVKSWTFTGTASASDADTIAWTAGKLYDDAGSVLYSIGSGSTGNMTAESIVYFAPETSLTAFATSTKAAYIDKINRVKVLAANNSDTAEGSQATFSYLTPVSGFSTTGTQLLIASNALANASMTSTLAKKGMQGWATDLIFEGTDWDDIKWHKVDGADSANGSVSFSDNVEEAITYGDKTFSGADLGKTVYCYKTVGDSPSATLVFTRDYTDLYTDSRILLATFVVAGSDDTTDSPSIFPFNGSQPTVSAGLISAGAITASNIQADTITANEISANAVTANELIAGAITSKHTITGAIVQTDAGANTGVKMISASSALRIYEGNLEFYTSDGYARGSLRAQNFTWANGSTVRPGISVYGPSTSSLSSPTIANLALFGHQVGNSSQVYDAVSGQSANTSMLVYGSAEVKGTSGNYARVFFTASDDAPQGALYVAGGVPINMPADLETKQRMLVMSNDNALADYWKFDVSKDGSDVYRKFMYASNSVAGGTVDGTVGESYNYLGSYHNGTTWTSAAFTGVQSYYHNAGDGALAAPGFNFSSDSNTGLYRISSGNIGISGDGTLRGQFGFHSQTIAPSSGGTTAYVSFSTLGNYGLWGASGASYFGHVLPAIDDFYDLGGSTLRFDDVRATNSTIQTSDVRLKEKINPSTLGLDFVNDLNPISYKWKKKKENKLDQTHYGIIAQEVMETLKKYGVDSVEGFGGITHDGGEEDYYGARYAEFVPILIKAVQELSDVVNQLKEKE